MLIHIKCYTWINAGIRFKSKIWGIIIMCTMVIYTTQHFIILQSYNKMTILV